MRGFLDEIKEMGHQEELTASGRALNSNKLPKTVKATGYGKSPRTARKKDHFGGFADLATGADGTLKEEWDPYLPRPPSNRELKEEDMVDPNAEQVAVFNANTHEGSTMVRVLSEKGLKVVAAVRVFTSKNTKALMKLRGVTVKVADWSDKASLLKVAEGCKRAFLVTKYWEKFDSKIEQQMCVNILQACGSVDPPIKNMVLSTFEDTTELIRFKRRSQLVPDVDGKIYPKFEGMAAVDKMAKELKMQLTHMFTSYLDEKDRKKSLILIRGHTGRIVVQPHEHDVASEAKTLM